MIEEPSPKRPKPQARNAFVADLTTLPNLVSMARIVMVYVTMGLWYAEEFRIGAIVGITAGLTDYLDGYLARKLNQQTRIGGLLDQAADILFLTGCLFLFVHDGTWPVALLFIVLFRETLVMNLRASAAEMGFSLPSIFLGKWSSNWMFWALAIMGVTKAQVIPEPFNTYATYVSHFGMTVGVISSLITASIYLKRYAEQYRPKNG